MRKPSLLGALIVSLLSTAALAGIPAPNYQPTITTTPATTTETSRTSTQAYAGLNWTIGGGYTPALVLGVTNAKVKSNGDTSGARLALHINLTGGFAPGLLKLSYLNGKDDLQGEIGLGYNFIKSAPALGLGINGPYVSAGIDGYLSSGIVPYVSLNSQGAFSKPKANTVLGSNVASCDSGDVLLGNGTCEDRHPFRP